MTQMLYKYYTPPYDKITSTMYGGDPLGGNVAASAQQLSYDEPYNEGWVSNHLDFTSGFLTYEVRYADPADNPFKDLENYEESNPGWYLSHIRHLSLTEYPKTLTASNNNKVLTLPNSRIGSINDESTSGGPPAAWTWLGTWGLNDNQPAGCAFAGVDGYVRGSDLANMRVAQHVSHSAGYAFANTVKIWQMWVEIHVTDVAPTNPPLRLSNAGFNYRMRRI